MISLASVVNVVCLKMGFNAVCQKNWINPRCNPGALHCILSCEMVSYQAIWCGTSYTHPIFGCYPSLMGAISCINRCIVHLLGCSSPAREYSWCLGGTILKPCLEVWNHPAVDPPSRTHPSSAWGKRISRSQNLEHTFALAPGGALVIFASFPVFNGFLVKIETEKQDSDFIKIRLIGFPVSPLKQFFRTRSVAFSGPKFPTSFGAWNHFWPYAVASSSIRSPALGGTGNGTDAWNHPSANKQRSGSYPWL